MPANEMKGESNVRNDAIDTGLNARKHSNR